MKLKKSDFGEIKKQDGASVNMLLTADKAEKM